MRWYDRIAARQISHAARQPENAMIGARRQIQPTDRLLQQVLARCIEWAELLDLPGAERGIGFSLPQHLARTRRLYAIADGGAGLACGSLHQFVLRQRRHADLDVDAVEQRA